MSSIRVLAASQQQNQYCKSTDVDRAPTRIHARTPRRPRRETIDSVMAMLGLSCRREVEASLDSPSNELSLPCKQEVQNALSGFSHVRARRPQYTVVSERLCSRAGPRRRRGAAHPRGDRNRETPARHRRVLCRRGPGRRPGALRPAATEGRGRLLEEKEVAAAVEEEGVLICVHSVRKGGS